MWFLILAVGASWLMNLLKMVPNQHPLKLACFAIYWGVAWAVRELLSRNYLAAKQAELAELERLRESEEQAETWKDGTKVVAAGGLAIAGMLGLPGGGFLAKKLLPPTILAIKKVEDQIEGEQGGKPLCIGALFFVCLLFWRFSA